MTQDKFSMQPVMFADATPEEEVFTYHLPGSPHFQYEPFAVPSRYPFEIQPHKQYVISLVQAAWRSLKQLQRTIEFQQQDALNTLPLSRPQAISNYFLDRAKSAGKSLSPLKLLKLVCIAHGWALAVLNRPLFREPIEVWSFGLVVPSLYHEFKIFQKSAIDRYAFEYDFAGNISIPKVSPSDGTLSSLLDKVWEIYKDYSAAELAQLTYQEGAPWFLTKAVGQQYIDNSLMAAHYRQLLVEIDGYGLFE